MCHATWGREINSIKMHICIHNTHKHVCNPIHLQNKKKKFTLNDI